MQSDQTVKNETQLILSNELYNKIYSISKLAKFISVFGFILTLISIISVLIVGIGIKLYDYYYAMNSIIMGMGFAEGNNIGFSMTYITLSILVIFYPSLILYKFSFTVKNGILDNNEAKLIIGFGKLKTLLKYVILAIIIPLILFALGIGILILMLSTVNFC